MIIIASAAGVITSIGPITFPRQLRTFDFNLYNWEFPKGFGDPGFPLSGARDTGFQSKIVARFEIESMRGRWNAKDNPRDYDIALFLGRNYGIEELTEDALNSFSLI